MSNYTYECKQANGTIYRPYRKGFNRNQAAAAMREDKAIFSKCTDWKLVKLS